MAEATLTEALGKGRDVEWKGENVFVEPFDMNDIADLEDALDGEISRLDLRKTRHQLLVLWLVLRRLDKTLTPEARRACRYNMTREDAGRTMKAAQLNKAETLRFLYECVKISGLYGDEAENGTAPKNEEAASG